MTDLTDLPHVGDKRAERLREQGYESAEEVRDATVEELAALDGVGEPLAKAMLGEDDSDSYSTTKPTKLDKLEDKAIEHARLPQTKTGVARDLGVPRQRLHKWVSNYPEFAAKFRKARGQAERALILATMGDRSLLDELLSTADKDIEVDTQFAKFLLARSFDYRETQEHEIDANVDQNTTVEVEFNEEVVDSPWSPDNQP